VIGFGGPPTHIALLRRLCVSDRKWTVGDARGRLLDLVELGCRARSPVVRDGHDRTIELVPDPEAPSRLMKAVLQLRAGLVAIGVPEDRLIRLVEHVVIGSIPKTRRQVLDHLVRQQPEVLPTTAVVGDAVGLPTTTVGRALEDLAAHRVVDRSHDGDRINRWRACDEARRLLGSPIQTLTEDDGEGEGF
jgi:hypothetical protein